MKELNKLIEGIAFPIKYDEELRCFVDSSEEEYTICKPMGYFASAAGRHLIAHALNNLNSENHAISRNSDNLQPKEGEDTKTADSIYSGKDGYQNTLYTADQLFAMATHVAEWAVTNPEKAGPMTMPEWRAHYKEYFLPVFTPFSGEAQLGAWTTEAQKEAAKGRAFIDDTTPEAQMRRENK